jgi:hypothetical protein
MREPVFISLLLTFFIGQLSTHLYIDSEKNTNANGYSLAVAIVSTPGVYASSLKTATAKQKIKSSNNSRLYSPFMF